MTSLKITGRPVFSHVKWDQDSICSLGGLDEDMGGTCKARHDAPLPRNCILVAATAAWRKHGSPHGWPMLYGKVTARVCISGLEKGAECPRALLEDGAGQ